MNKMRNVMLRNFQKIFLYSFLMAFFAVPFSLHAQFTPGMGVTVALEPPYPGAGESVVLTLTAYSTDLNQAYIEWSVDGSLRQQGNGLTSYTVTAPSVGVNRVIDIQITLASGEVTTQKVLITPAEITLFEQTDSYTPPFYKGRSLTTPESTVSLIALPNLISRSGTRVSASNLVFTWKRNGRVLGADSGIGKNVLKTKASRVPGERITISVQVSTADKTVTAVANHTLTSHAPELLLYESNPVLGVMLNKATSKNYILNKNEISLIAYPYFFESSNPIDSKFSYDWKINGKRVAPTGTYPNEIVLRKPDTEAGTSALSLTVTNTTKLFETVSRSLEISFGETGKSVNFGF